MDKSTTASTEVWSHRTMQRLENAGIITLTDGATGQPTSPNAVKAGESVLMRSFSGNTYSAQRSDPLNNWSIDELEITHQVVRI